MFPWSWITQLVAGIMDPVTKITGQITQIRLEQEQAKTNKDRIAANERLKTLEARRDVLINSRGSWLGDIVRGLFAVPFVIYINKLLIWDKVLNWGSTDPLSSDLTYLLMVVVGFYFLHWTIGSFRR